LNESSTESGRDDESGHDDSARVLDEVAEISFTCITIQVVYNIFYSSLQFHSTNTIHAFYTIISNICVGCMS
jgi:hypothetical protein